MWKAGILCPRCLITPPLLALMLFCFFKERKNVNNLEDIYSLWVKSTWLILMSFTHQGGERFRYQHQKRSCSSESRCKFIFCKDSLNLLNRVSLNMWSLGLQSRMRKFSWGVWVAFTSSLPWFSSTSCLRPGSAHPEFKGFDPRGWFPCSGDWRGYRCSRADPAHQDGHLLLVCIFKTVRPT